MNKLKLVIDFKGGHDRAMFLDLIARHGKAYNITAYSFEYKAEGRTWEGKN